MSLRNIGYGDVRGFMGANCRHNWHNFFVGISTPAYSPEELSRLNAENNRLIEIDGVSKKGYEWKQTMRALERGAREAKGQMEVLKAAGDTEGVRKLKIKLSTIENRYNKIAENTEIKAQYERMSIVKGNPPKTVDNSGRSGYNKYRKTQNIGYFKELKEPMQGDVPETVKNDNVSSSEIQSHTQTNSNKNNVSSHQSQAITANNAGDSLSVQIDNNAQDNSSVNASDYPNADNPPLVAAENPSVGDVPVLSAGNSGSDTQQSGDDKTAFEGNPVQNTTDTEQIEKELGYSIKTPDYIPENYQIGDMCVIAGGLAQITYESENDTICYRTSKGNEDISGDYNTYTNVEKININNSEVIIQGDDNLYHKASWTNNDEVFSVCSDSGIEKEIMIDIVESVN